MVMSSAGLRAEIDCAGEGQQQLSSCQRGCYIRIVAASVQLKKNAGRESQGVGAKTKLLAVNRHSQSNSGSEEVFSWKGAAIRTGLERGSRGIAIVISRYQATASGDRNRMRTLDCVPQ
jgi:hypothetical protein